MSSSLAPHYPFKSNEGMWLGAAVYAATQDIAFNARRTIEELEAVVQEHLDSLGAHEDHHARQPLAAQAVDWLVVSPCGPASFHTGRGYVYYRNDGACHNCAAFCHHAYDYLEGQATGSPDGDAS